MFIQHLNIPHLPFTDVNWKRKLPTKGHIPISLDMVNAEMVDWFEMLGMYIKNVDVFCSPPGFRLPIHVDGKKIDNCCAINWAYCDEDGALMEWWKPISDKINTVTPGTEKDAYNITTTPYAFAWKDEECNKVFESEVKQPSLVNIGQPHAMSNHTNSQRFAISITWKRFDGMDMQFEDAYQRLDKALALQIELM